MSRPCSSAPLAAPPSFGDGTTIVVLSPQHSNVVMPIVVETWTGRPASDRDQWEQVSEHRLEAGAARSIEIDSPTMDTITCDVPPGRYLVEIRVRGFNAEAQWRLRLWPTDAR